MGPVCTIMVGRLDDWLKVVVEKERITIDPGYLEWAGVAVFKKAYQIFRQRGYRIRLLSAAFRNHMHWSESSVATSLFLRPTRGRFVSTRATLRSNLASTIRSIPKLLRRSRKKLRISGGLLPRAAFPSMNSIRFAPTRTHPSSIHRCLRRPEQHCARCHASKPRRGMSHARPHTGTSAQYPG